MVTVTNPVASRHRSGGGRFGLAGLAERVGAAGGFLDHRATGGEFRLVAMLPTKAPDLPAEPQLSRSRVAMLGRRHRRAAVRAAAGEPSLVGVG